MAEAADGFGKTWITDNALAEIANYPAGMLTLRGLHYRLVARGMTNTIQHYKRVVKAMGDARWEGFVAFETFSDHDRSMVGFTDSNATNVNSQISYAKDQVVSWMSDYSKNKWENQPYYPEIWIEKKALQGVFDEVCSKEGVALGPCKGYPSLTFLNDGAKRFSDAVSEGKQPIILYFGDYDPSGEDIPRSVKENIELIGCDNIKLRRIALMRDQVVEWELPPAPAKKTDSRTKHWNGLGQVELDAVEPKQLQELCREAINSVFDEDKYTELIDAETNERVTYRKELKEYVMNLEL